MFEHSLIGLAERKKSRRGWFSLPMAIAIHLVALATFTFASVWEVGKVPEPSMNIDPFIEVILPEPPDPPPALGGGRPETPTPVQQAEVQPPAPDQPVQPQDVPEEFPPVLTQVTTTEQGIPGVPPGPGRPDGVDGGDEYGDPNSNVIGSVTRTPPPVVVAQPVDDEPIIVSGPVKRPEILVKTQPRYTELARRANIEGIVVLKAVIDERGYVTNLEVLKDLPMGLDKAAVDAVRTWRFKPATLHDRPVKVYYNLTVNFTIQR